MASVRVCASTRKGYVQMTFDVPGPQYWKFIEVADSRGATAAELLDEFLTSIAGAAPDIEPEPAQIPQRVSMKPAARLARYERIAELAEQNLSLSKIAREVGMTAQGVSAALRKIRSTPR